MPNILIVSDAVLEAVQATLDAAGIVYQVENDTDASTAVADALGEWEAFRFGVPGARTASGDFLAESTRNLVAVYQSARVRLADADERIAQAWDEGHATDEHGTGLCECPNPYRAPNHTVGS